MGTYTRLLVLHVLARSKSLDCVRRADDDTRYAIMVGVMANAFSAHSVSAIGGLRLHPLVPLRLSSSLSLPTPMASPCSICHRTVGARRNGFCYSSLLAWTQQ
jgi:hypothetical protein